MDASMHRLLASALVGGARGHFSFRLTLLCGAMTPPLRTLMVQRSVAIQLTF